MVIFFFFFSIGSHLIVSLLSFLCQEADIKPSLLKLGPYLQLAGFLINNFADKGLSSQSYGFSRSHLRMWELDHKEGWAQKNWCFQTVELEKTLESPLDFKEI